MQDAGVFLPVPLAERLLDLFAMEGVNSGPRRVDGEVTRPVRATSDSLVAGEVGRDLGTSPDLTLPEDAHGQSRLAGRGAQLERQSFIDRRDDPIVIGSGGVHPRVMNDQARLAAVHLDAVGVREAIRTQRLNRPGNRCQRHLFFNRAQNKEQR
jgi:hypothetical protein